MAEKLLTTHSLNLYTHSKQLIHQQLEAAIHTYEKVAKLAGIQISLHIDPRLPVNIGNTSLSLDQNIKQILSQTIEHTPWTKIEISLLLIKISDTLYNVKLEIWGSGTELNTVKGRKISPLSLLYGNTFSLLKKSSQHQPFALIISTDQVLVERVRKYVTPLGIHLYQADRLTSASRIITEHDICQHNSAIFIDSHHGSIALRHYPAILEEVTNNKAKLSLLVSNAIEMSFTRKYHQAGYYSVVNTGNSMEMSNAIEASFFKILNQQQPIKHF